MKHRCINGWTPHTVFEAVKANGQDLLYYWFSGIGNVPFKPKGMEDFFCDINCFSTDEDTARWLVAHTEGDW
jgi:hypothetical protein